MTTTIDELEKRVAVLEAKAATAPSGGPRPTDTFDPSKLSEHWADKPVRKLPSKWKGRDVTGELYSTLSAKEATDLAGFFEWKAQKGREEVPVRCRDDGKPWHESDAFEAKLLRTWASVASAPKVTPAASRYGTSGHGASAKHTAPVDYFVDAVEDEIPF